jgi:hypothetical protein
MKTHSSGNPWKATGRKRLTYKAAAALLKKRNAEHEMGAEALKGQRLHEAIAKQAAKKKRECADCGDEMPKGNNLRTCAHCGLKVCGHCYTHRGHHPIFHDRVPPIEKFLENQVEGPKMGMANPTEVYAELRRKSQEFGDKTIVRPPQRLGHHLSGHKLLSGTKCQGPTKTSLGHAGELAPVQLRVSNRVNQWKPGIVPLCQNCRKLLNGGWRYVKPFPGTDKI